MMTPLSHDAPVPEGQDRQNSLRSRTPLAGARRDLTVSRGSVRSSLATYLYRIVDGGCRPVSEREGQAGNGEGTASRQAAVQADDPWLALELGDDDAEARQHALLALRAEVAVPVHLPMHICAWMVVMRQ